MKLFAGVCLVLLLGVGLIVGGIHFLTATVHGVEASAGTSAKRIPPDVVAQVIAACGAPRFDKTMTGGPLFAGGKMRQVVYGKGDINAKSTRLIDIQFDYPEPSHGRFLRVLRDGTDDELTQAQIHRYLPCAAELLTP